MLQGTLLSLLLFLTMITNIGVLSDLALIEACFRSPKSSPIDILEQIPDLAATNNMTTMPKIYLILEYTSFVLHPGISNELLERIESM